MAGWTDALTAVAGGVNVLGSLYQNNENKKMMREQMKYNTSEREASQQFQDEQRLAMQGYQTSEREAQNKWYESIYNQYQSPQALAMAYKEAGFNPNLALDGSNVGNVAAGSNGGAPSSGAPSGRSISAPYQDMTSFSRGFQDMAAAAASLASAKKSGVETSQMEESFKARMKQLDLSNAAQELMNSVNYKYLDKHTEALLNRVIQEYSTGALQQQEMRKQLELLADAHLLNKKTLDHWDETYANAQANIKADTNFKNEQADTQSSIRELNKASAALARSQSLTEKTKRELNESMSEINKVLKRIYNTDAYVAENTKHERVTLSDEQLKVVHTNLELLSAKAAKAAKDADWYEFDILHDYISSVSKILSGKR